MVRMIVGIPDLARVFKRFDDVGEGTEKSLGGVGDVVLLTQGLHQGSHFVEVVTRHGWEEMVLDLEVQMSREPIIEPAFFDVTRSMKL